jgi:hypothetical protein
VAYPDFTVSEAARRFLLTVDETTDIFAPVVEVAPSDLLQTQITENAPLALALQTEKARSELLITPILLEVRRRTENRIAFFSGVDFNVDPSQGLNGVCDYLLARSPEQWFVRAPVMAIVEAKNENIKGGIGQCIAAMVAAQRFNEREGEPQSDVYGAVTTGDIWKFLRLSSSLVQLDIATYYLDSLPAILGNLLRIVR